MLLNCARLISSPRALTVFLALLIIGSGLLFAWNNSQASLPLWTPRQQRPSLEHSITTLDPWQDAIQPCIGPGDKEISGGSESRVQERVLDGGKTDSIQRASTTLTLHIDLPRPYAGSYVELHMPFSWSTAQERYGPYGFAEENSTGLAHNFDWATVDWADLQNQCLQRNTKAEASHTIKPLSASRRLRLPTWGEGGHWIFSRKTSPRPKITSGRTAIVLRTWSTFEFKDEDYWNLRSLITETALRYGGRYTVILLVDIKEPDLDVWNNPQDYDKVLSNIPTEFRNMTVLFDQHRLLAKWYPRVREHR